MTSPSQPSTQLLELLLHECSKAKQKGVTPNNQTTVLDQQIMRMTAIEVIHQLLEDVMKKHTQNSRNDNPSTDTLSMVTPSAKQQIFSENDHPARTDSDIAITSSSNVNNETKSANTTAKTATTNKVFLFNEVLNPGLPPHADSEIATSSSNVVNAQTNPAPLRSTIRAPPPASIRDDRLAINHQTITSLEQKVADLTTELGTKSAEINSLNQRLTTLSLSVDGKASIISENKSEVQGLRDQVRELQALVESVEDRLPVNGLEKGFYRFIIEKTLIYTTSVMVSKVTRDDNISAVLVGMNIVLMIGTLFPCNKNYKPLSKRMPVALWPKIQNPGKCGRCLNFVRALLPWAMFTVLIASLGFGLGLGCVDGHSRWQTNIISKDGSWVNKMWAPTKFLLEDRVVYIGGLTDTALMTLINLVSTNSIFA